MASPQPLLSYSAAETALVSGSLFQLNESVSRQVNASADASVRQLVIVDAATPNYQQLLGDLTARNLDAAATAVVMLDAQSDGIAAIAQILSHYHNLDALHIVSHGETGAVKLGTALLDTATLPFYANSLRDWSAALKDTGDILFYGCDVAGSADGRLLVDEIHLLTGRDVAASTDQTGSAELGGNWTLEFTAGNIETPVVFSTQLQASYDYVLDQQTFAAGSYIVDMGQSTQTIGNALKPYGLIYDMVTNYKVPVDWAINPDKTTFRLDAGNPIPVDFTATITSGTGTSVKAYSGGSFIIDVGFLTPTVVTEINTWKAQGVVIDTLATPLTTEIYGEITSFPRAVLDTDNGALAVPYYTNAGVPSSSYQIGNPTDLTHCDDVYILPHADPQDWSEEWKLALYNFVVDGGGLWAACHAVSALEALTTVDIGGVPTQLNFLSNGMLEWGDHSAGTLPYSYNSAAANDPIMQIMNRLDGATTNGSEQIYVPTTLDWRSTTTVAVYDPDHPDNPLDGTSPFNDAGVVAYGYAYGDSTNGLVMYEGGHSLAKSTAAANIAAQRAFFNFLLTEGIIKAPKASISHPPIVAGVASTLTATISGGSGSYTYQWVSTNGGIFSSPTGTATAGVPITTQYTMPNIKDTIRLVIADIPCGRGGISSEILVDPPPTIDLDANDSSGAIGANYKNAFAGGAIVSAADTDTLITDNGTTIASAVIALTTRPDGANETLLIDTTLATSFGITVTPDGNGGFTLSGTASLSAYMSVIASLQYENTLDFPNPTDRIINVTVNDGFQNSNTAVSRLVYLAPDLATETKNLYLNDPLGLNRIDPVFTGDTTTAQTVDITGPQAVTQTVVASDNFNSNTYTGGSGWLAGWTEIGDDGSTTTGDVRIVTDLGDPSLRLHNDQNGASRAVNLTGSAQALLTFDYRREALDNATDNVLVQISTDGTTWTTVYEVAGPTNDTIYLSSPVINITPYISANTRIRFLSSGMTNAGDFIYIDNVQVTQLTGGGTPAYQSVADNFDPAGGYAGNDGTSNWVNNWTESGDDNSATTGAFQTTSPGAPVTGFALRISPDTDAPLSAAVGDNISRTVNLSGVGQATLLYDYFMPLANNGTGTIEVQVSPDGTTWTTLTTYNQNDSGPGFASFDISNYSTANTQIRFRIAATDNNNDFYYFDNVRVEYMQGGQSTTLTPSQDTWINGANATTQTYNYGANATLSIDREGVGLERSLFQFDLSALPSNAVLTSAQLVLTKTGGATATQTIDVFGLSSAWAEGNNVTGAPGAASWLQRQTGVNWTTAGGDFTNTSVASRLVGANGSYTWDVTNLVNAWLTGSRANDGFLLYSLDAGGNNSQTFASSENLTAASRPQLVLKYATFSTGTNSVTFTQDPTMVAPFIMPSAEPVSATAYIQVTGGTFVNPPNIDALLSVAGTNFATLTGVPTVTPVSPGIYRLDWTGTTDTTTSMAAGDAITLTLRANDPGFTFKVLYDSQTYPSQIRVDTVTYINVESLAVYNAAYPGGSPITTTEAGQPAHVRFTVSDPFGASDINGADLVIKDSGNVTVATAALTDTAVVASTAGTKTYEYAGWTPSKADTFTIIVTVKEGTEGTVTDTAQTTIIATAHPDLVITKTDFDTTVSAGGSVAYTINYANNDLGDATGVVITESLPAGSNFNVAGSTAGWVAVGGGQYQFTVGSLPSGASGSVVFSVTVPDPVPAGLENLQNTVQITDDGTHGADTNPANNTGMDDTPVIAAPDLQITKSDQGATALPGGIVLYYITYTNVGTQNASGVVLQETLPANTIFNSDDSTPGWVSEGPSEYELDIGNVPVGFTGTATFAVTVVSPLPVGVSELFNTVLIQDDGVGGPDPTPADNTASDTTPVVAIDLGIVKDDGSTTYTPGSTVTYTITVTNITGPIDAVGATVADSIPAGLTGVTWTSTPTGTASVTSGATGSGNSLAATVNIAAGVGNSVIFTVTGTALSSLTGDLVNTATVTAPAGTTDNNTANDSSTDTDTADLVSDLSITKTDGVATVVAGDGVNYTYTITVHNGGTSDAQNVVVTDTFPAGFSQGTITSSQGSFAGNTWTVGTLAAGATATLTIAYTVPASTLPGVQTNIATVGSTTSDPNPGNNSASDETTVAAPVKTASISGYVYLDLNNNGIKNPGEQGIARVKVRLYKMVDARWVQVAVTYTNASGYFSFKNLAPGTYRIVEAPTPAYRNGTNSVGTVNGKKSGRVVGDSITNIVLRSGGRGVNYNFTERPSKNVFTNH